MEADWDVEAGASAPVIDPHWPGFVDLRAAPEQASELSEAAELPALARALVALNAPDSPVLTAKCDVWPVDSFDPDELDAPCEGSLQAIGCYIDLLPRSERQWKALDEVVDWCKRLCARMRAVPLRSCRVDMVVRSASLAAERLDWGVTSYLTAVGPNHAAAAQVMDRALAVLADSICAREAPAKSASKLQ